MTNTNTFHNDRYFRTSSFYLASFLLAKEQVLVNIDKVTDPRRAQFVFLDSPEMAEFIQSFNYAKENSPDALVDMRKAVASIRSLKEKLYEGDRV